jgi:hypothetical protein
VSTLWKRASPREAKVLRIICGAVLNTSDAHPGKYKIDARFARGVAKRAVGTLSAQWADVLAVELSRPSRAASGNLVIGSRAGDTSSNSGLRSAQLLSRKLGGASERLRSLAPLKRAEKELARRISPARARGEIERANALIEALTVMGTFRKRAERAL